jgi:hypothetical protein
MHANVNFWWHFSKCVDKNIGMSFISYCHIEIHLIFIDHAGFIITTWRYRSVGAATAIGGKA